MVTKTVIHAFNPTVRKAETGGFPAVPRPASLAYLVTLRAVKNPVSNRKQDGLTASEEQHPELTPDLHTQVHTCASGNYTCTHEHTHP